jgi:hypothetical protein
VVESGWECTVYESAEQPAGSVRDWGHVRLFTPWSMNVSDRARSALGERAPGGAGLPTGAELASELLDPIAALPAIASRVRLGHRVIAVSREGLLKHEEIGTGRRADHPFRLLVSGPDGVEKVEHAGAVIDCTGTFGNPNALGDGGIPAPGERALASRIDRCIPRVGPEWAGQRILLTGAGHSAQTAARELAQLAREAPGTHVTWAVRAPAPDWGAVSGDPLPERAGLAASARELAGGASPAVEVRAGCVTDSLQRSAGGAITVALRNGGGAEIEVDRVLALNGGVGDFGLYRQLQVHECYATSGPMKLAAALLGETGGDCLAQAGHGAETLENPEPGFFILGSKSYGRNSQFLLRVGWEQVRDVFGLLERQRG